MLRILVNILIRQANLNNAADPSAWLAELQTAKFTALSNQNGQISGTMVNGKSVTIQALPGCSIADLIAATELALNVLAAGLDAAPSRTQAVLG